MRRLALLAVAQGDADPRPAPIVPGRLDLDAARVAGAGLRDRARLGALAGLLERGDESEPAGELRRSPEAGEVADLEREHERRERVDAVEAAQPRHRLAPLRLEREVQEPLVEGDPAGEQAVDGGECVQVGQLGVDALEALAGEPAAVPLRPGRLLRVGRARSGAEAWRGGGGPQARCSRQLQNQREWLRE